MKMINALTIVICIFIFPSGVTACEKYKSFSVEELKESRDILSKSDADPLDRMFAFEQLACSDHPSVRNYAIQEGLKLVDPLVRNQVMFKAMMQKTRIDVELSSNKELTNLDKKFISDNAGVYSKIVMHWSQEYGCLSFHSSKRCSTHSSLYIKGNKVEYNSDGIFGEFRLSQAGELVGFLRKSNSRIPAVIKLF